MRRRPTRIVVILAAVLVVAGGLTLVSCANRHPSPTSSPPASATTQPGTGRPTPSIGSAIPPASPTPVARDAGDRAERDRDKLRTDLDRQLSQAVEGWRDKYPT